MNPNLENIDIRLLRCFDVLMAERSVSRAAQRMNLSQPAMSIALRKLRELFGDPLLVRAHNEMVPTSRATMLAGTVHRTLDALAALVEEAVPFSPRTSKCRFTLTVPSYISLVLLPRLATRLQRLAPGIDLDVRASNREHAVEWLERAEVDFRIGWVREPPGTLHSKALYRDRFVCIARKGHRRIGPRLGFEQLCSLPHVRALIDKRSDSGQVVDQAVKSAGGRLQVKLVVQDTLIVPEVVAGSDMIAVVPARLARGFARRLPIRILALPLNLPEQEIALYWHERMHRDAAHQWFRDLVGAVARTL